MDVSSHTEWFEKVEEKKVGKTIQESMWVNGKSERERKNKG